MDELASRLFSSGFHAETVMVPGGNGENRERNVRFLDGIGRTRGGGGGISFESLSTTTDAAVKVVDDDDDEEDGAKGCWGGLCGW